MSITTDKFELKAYSKKELAEKYQVSVKTFNAWLKPFEDKIGVKRGRYYTVNQVKTMLEVLGVPGTVN
jgi:transposase